MFRVSIDLAGGENAPHAILEAARNKKDIYFIFVGPEGFEELIKQYDIKNFSFIKAEIVLKEGEKFSNAQLENSSLALAIMQVKLGKADFVLSAGPSGYYLLLARRILGMIGNLQRPALAAVFPKLQGDAIMLDLGANITCSALDLAHFGVLGVSLSKYWLNKCDPKVFFLNVGKELGKGPQNIRDAFEIFQNIMPGSACGFIEGGDVLHGKHDVIVADGFVGNCILKFGEGSMQFFKHKMKEVFNQGFWMRIFGFFMQKKLRKAFIDPSTYNGAVLAGVNGCVIKSHGSSNMVAFDSAIKIGLKIALKKDIFFNMIKTDLALCEEFLQKNG